MQTGELARRLDIPVRVVRYALEQGYANTWVRRTEGSGHYRDLAQGEAFALALLMKLIQAGVKGPIAEKIVGMTEEGLQSVACAFVWDFYFQPFLGNLNTERQWYIDIADGSALRLATDASPSAGGKIEEFPWTDVQTRKTLKDYDPCVMMRIDLSRLARMVQAQSKEDTARAPDGTREKR